MAKKIAHETYVHMKKGLVLGKFMPLHTGHIALIDFALEHCDALIILLCYHANEPITGETRINWLNECYAANPSVTVFPYEYDPAELTDSSVPNQDDAGLWAQAIQKLFTVDIIFSSEDYGDYLARFLNIRHVPFDKARSQLQVSGNMIRKDPFLYWNCIPNNVRPFFVKKIVLLGSESTGKSTLTERLATHFSTNYVSEKARDVISHTHDCKYEDLVSIAHLHAKAITNAEKLANKLLFIDTDLNITRSYARFLFKKDLKVPVWMELANKAELYLFLENDCGYVQDGTRLSEEERDELANFHKQQLELAGINYRSIKGNWEERFKLACIEVENLALNK